MRRVLAVGAHPDDIELGCAGTLLAHRAAGDEVTMLVLTNGQSGPGDVRRRRAEQDGAAAVLDVNLRWGGLIDCAMRADANTIAIVEAALRDTQADVVYVHHPDDTHQDHRAAAQATLSAARRHTRVLHYQSPSSTGFTPNVFVDVSAHLDGKLKALTCHATQVARSSMVEPDAVAATARHYGALARITYAEAFFTSRFVWDLAPAGTGRAAAGTAVVPASWQQEFTPGNTG